MPDIAKTIDTTDTHPRATTGATVILPARDTGRTLAPQCRALLAAPRSEVGELIVSVQRSRDDTLAVAEAVARDDDRVTVVECPGHGVAAARNTATAAASADVLVFCDADDVAEPGMVAALADGARRDGFCAGELVSSDGRGGWVRVRNGELVDPFGFWPFAVGACMAIDATALRSLGGFDPALLTGDDVDLSWRAHAAGLAIRHVPDARLRKSDRGTMRAALKQYWRFGFDDVALYQRWRAHGMPRLPAAGRTAVRPARGQLRTHAGRLAWARDAGKAAGHITGGLRHRVRYR